MRTTPSPRPVLHLIPQAHLDPVWLWPWRDGAAEALTTLQSAVDRAREFPEFTFTRSTASLYRWVFEQDPRLFAAIRRLVRAGRWEVVGGWLEQPDCNLPSAESFVRQAALGRQWLRQHLGPRAETTIGYNVDSFGHHGGLPQLLRLTGCRHYVFMRPEASEAREVPDLFWWEGLDGSRVLAQRVPTAYSQPPGTTADEVEQFIREKWARHVTKGFTHGVFWLGVGNHGGGPTCEHLRRIRQLQCDPTLPELRFSSLRAYFAAIESAPAALRALPVVRGDLHHRFRGCYAATAAVKQDHRRCELRLRTTESLAALAPAAKITRADRETLDDLAWQLGDLQFHDILAGTCSAGVQRENRERFGAVAAGTDRLRVRLVHRLARRVDTRDVSECALFVHNPLPWARRALVELDTFRDPHGQGAYTHLRPPGGELVPIQWLATDAVFGPWMRPWGRLTAWLDLPASGHRVFELVAAPPAPGGAPRFRWPGHRLTVQRDHHDTWGHTLRTYDNPLGEFRLVDEQRLERGPHLVVHRRQYRWKQSRAWLDARVAPDGSVELHLRLDWRQRRETCRLELPTPWRNAEFVTKTAGGVAARPDDGTEQAGLEWCALSTPSPKPRTLVVATDSNYSYSSRRGTLRFVLARGTPFAEHPPITVPRERPEPFTDEGWSERRFWLRQSAGSWQEAAPDRFAANVLVPPEVMLDNAHAGDLGREVTGWRLAPEHVSLLAAKPASQGGGTVLRVQEMSGRPTRASLRDPRGARHAFRLRAFEVKTLRVTSDHRLVDAGALEPAE